MSQQTTRSPAEVRDFGRDLARFALQWIHDGGGYVDDNFGAIEFDDIDERRLGRELAEKLEVWLAR